MIDPAARSHASRACGSSVPSREVAIARFLVQRANHHEERDLNDQKHVLRILNRTGDTQVAWAPGVKTEEKEAQKTFDKMAKQGYLMFAVEAPGKTPEQVRKFDPKAFEIVAVPQFRGG
jgi:hypothetical protein